MGGESDDWDVASDGIVFEDLGCLPAVDHRDGDIHQDEIGLFGARLGDSLLSYKKLYHFDFGNDISVFDKIIDTDNLNATQVINIAKETVRELL
jgi:cytidylate kinase